MKPVWLSSKEKEDLATTFTRSLGPSTTVEQVREYISSGGDLLVPSKHGWKPLHSACKANCSLEVVTFILDSITNSGTVQEKNCDGSMRSIAADTISYKTGTFPSFDDITYCGVTPLHCLAEGGNNVEVAKLLLQRGANLEAWSVPVLRRAISGYKAQSWEEQLAHYSCQPGGKPLMYVDEKPQTPLSIACTHSRFELVEFFVQQGASKTIRGEKISFTMVDLIRSYSGVISQRNAERLEWILDNTKPNPLGTSVNVSQSSSTLTSQVTAVQQPSIDSILQQLNLISWLPTFQKEQIDFDALLLLTDQDLITMGLPLGPRKKILNYIATH